jgi:serine phosphatase RsbU (regulator of sigma subunit)
MALGVKFAAYIAVAVAIASLALVVAAYFTAAKQMDEEIDAAGIRAIKLVATAAADSLLRHKVTTEYDPFSKIDDKLGKFIPLISDAANQDQGKQLDREIRALLKEVQDVWIRKPLGVMGGSQAEEMNLDEPGIVNVIVLAGETGLLDGKKIEQIGLGGEQSRGKVEDIEIKEGTYSGSGGDVRVRSFKKPVMNDKGAQVGTAVLYLSARKIDDAKSAILTALILPLLLAIAIGAGIGFYMGSVVTAPLKALLADINRVSEGDLEHETKPRSTDEIGYLAKTFNLMTKSLASAHEAELANKAIEHELNIATEIQSNLLPHRIPKIPGYEIGAYYRPSKEVGGDYYDFIQIDQNHLGIIVADVSGKGIPGSMVMTMARSLIRMEAERNLSTADTLIKTNRILARDIRRGMFVTCLYALLDVRTKTLLVSSAGHNPLIVVRKQQGKYELINPNGIALGFDKGPIFERTIKEQQVPLHPGDRVVLYTDGIVEAMDAKNVEFGDERFYKMCQVLSEKDSNVFIKTIVEQLDEHKGDAPQHDDITLVSVRVMPQP